MRAAVSLAVYPGQATDCVSWDPLWAEGQVRKAVEGSDYEPRQQQRWFGVRRETFNGTLDEFAEIEGLW